MLCGRGQGLLALIAVIFPSLVYVQPIGHKEIIFQLDHQGTLEEVLSSSRELRQFTQTRCLSRMLNIYLGTFGEDMDYHSASALLSRLPGVLNTQPNYRFEARKTPDDPRFVEQWNLASIGVSEIWPETTGGVTYGGDTIVIGVMESGIDLDHEEFGDLLWKNRSEVPDNDFDDDQNGYVDDFAGISLDHGKDRHAQDPAGHGTGVIGVLGAMTNNGLGMASVNWSVKIALASTLDLSLANAIQAHSYFMELRRRYNETRGAQGAFIVAVNLSYGYEGLFEKDAPAFCNVIDRMGEQGIIAVGAAANNQANADLFGDLPAQCTSGHLIIVTNTDREDHLAVAGFGKTTVDLSAPGEAILTTVINGGYGTIRGTSYATPHVSAAIALLYSHPSQIFYEEVLTSPTASTQFLKGILLDHVTPVADLRGRTVSGGRLDLAKAYEAIRMAYPRVPTAAQELMIYPNPVYGVAGIHFETPVANFSISIFDISGKKMAGTSIAQAVTWWEVDLTGLAAGVYFVVLKDGAETSRAQFVKF